MSEITKNLDALYGELPKINCQGKCQESCGPIFMSGPEWQRIIRRLGYEPKGRPDLTCPMLKSDGKCSVYHIRPAICRLWGIVDVMPCPWGCKPERYLTKMEGHAFLNRIDSMVEK